MAIPGKIPTIPNPYTVGDLEEPIRVRFNQVVTTETSEISIDRPEGNASITIAGVLLDAATAFYEYPWSAGDLVAGEGQLVKARLFNVAATRRKSSAFFKINVEQDVP